MHKQLRGIKASWYGGWSGSLLWLLFLSFSHFYHQKYQLGMISFTFFAIGMLSGYKLRPWAHRQTPYWKLLTPIYFIVPGALAWALFTSDKVQFELNNLLLLTALLPILLPLLVLRNRTWDQVLDEINVLQELDDSILN